jgi:hypothetical protein
VLKVKLKALSNEKGYQMLIKTIKDGDWILDEIRTSTDTLC